VEPQTSTYTLRPSALRTEGARVILPARELYLEDSPSASFPEATRMSNDPAKRQAFERWVSALRSDAGAVLGEESGITSLEDQKTLVRLPKDVVRQLREREASRQLAGVDPDSTAIFQPPPELIARARRLAPPPKPERSGPSSSPPELLPEPRPTPLVAAPPAEDAVALPELPEPPLPALEDAVDADEPPFVMPSRPEPPAEAPLALVNTKRPARSAWPVILLCSALVGAASWFVLTHWDWTLQTLATLLRR
jgi:hypothetical protein